MNDRKPVDPLLAVGSRLIQLPIPVAFVGGATTGLLVTAPAAPRSTLDVEVLVEGSSYAEYPSVLVPVLRSLAAREDVSEGAPLCRWLLNGVLVDVMPTDTRVLGFSSRSWPAALASATEHRAPDGTLIRVVDAPHFLATKLEAFLGRGEGDFLSSKDIEDIMAVADGRPRSTTKWVRHPRRCALSSATRWSGDSQTTPCSTLCLGTSPATSTATVTPNSSRTGSARWSGGARAGRTRSDFRGARNGTRTCLRNTLGGDRRGFETTIGRSSPSASGPRSPAIRRHQRE